MKILKLIFLIVTLLGLITVSVNARGDDDYDDYWDGYEDYLEDYWDDYKFGYGPRYRYRAYGGYWGHPDYRFGYGRVYPPYYAYPYPPVVEAPSIPPPPPYIQRQENNQSNQELQAGYWYYCRKPEGYYPHIKKCPEGWMKVVPQSAPAQQKSNHFN